MNTDQVGDLIWNFKEGVLVPWTWSESGQDVFIIPNTIKHYSFRVDIIPKIGYTIFGREVQSLCI